MLDLGDEVGEFFLRNANRDLLRALRQFIQLAKQHQSQKNQDDLEGRDTKKVDLEAPATEEQLNYLKQLVGNEQYHSIDIASLNRGQASSLINDLRQRENVFFHFDDRTANALTHYFDEHNIDYHIPESISGAIIMPVKSVDEFVRDINEWEKAVGVQIQDLDLDAPNFGLNPQQIENLNRVQGEKVIEEPQVADGSLDMDGRTPDINQGIESHDGMDIDNRTLVMESTGFQWKEDLAARAVEARELANSHDELVARCADRGITLDHAADGEYLYRDSNSPWHNLRGDSLGERFSRDSFGTPSLAERAKDARDLAEGLAADRDIPMIDRSVPSR